MEPDLQQWFTGLNVKLGKGTYCETLECDLYDNDEFYAVFPEFVQKRNNYQPCHNKTQQTELKLFHIGGNNIYDGVYFLKFSDI